MADFLSIAAAALSVERYLTHCFETEKPVGERPTKAVLIRTADLETGARSEAIVEPALSIFVYRVDVNRTMRAAWSSVGSQEGRSRLPLDLYLLLTPWADNPDHELRILGCAMSCLDAQPILSGPLLDSLASWTPGDAVQVCPADLSTEDLMRTFDSLPIDYRLSVLYVARIVTIDESVSHPDPAVATLATGIVPSPEP